MAKKTNDAQVEPEVQGQFKGNLFVALQAATTEARILQHNYDTLVEQHAELKEKDEVREKSDEARGEVVEIVSPSGRLEYSADSIPLQTMMESLAELLAVMPTNEVHNQLEALLLIA